MTFLFWNTVYLHVRTSLPSVPKKSITFAYKGNLAIINRVMRTLLFKTIRHRTIRSRNVYAMGTNVTACPFGPRVICDSGASWSHVI